jgi:hypothetical protein
LQRVYKYLGKEVELPKKKLELNPAHLILKNLLKLEVGFVLQILVIEQIYASARWSRDYIQTRPVWFHASNRSSRQPWIMRNNCYRRSDEGLEMEFVDQHSPSPGLLFVGWVKYYLGQQ